MSAASAQPAIPPAQPVQRLVLAGSRRAGDPLCRAEGVASKAVIDVGGQPMLARVLRALEGSRAGGPPAWVLGLEGAALAAAADGVACRSLPSTARGPAGALLDALEGPVGTPLLVATCDHALLTPEIVSTFLDGSRAAGADLTVGLAERRVIEAAHPDTRRTYLRLGGAQLSGCNLFYLASPAALPVLRFWQRIEQDRKHPWRIARRFGVVTALRILGARSGPEGVFALLSRRLGVRVRPVLLPFAEAAIDVDKPADLMLVRGILAARAGSGG